MRCTRLTDLVPLLLQEDPAAVDRFVQEASTRLYSIARAAGASPEDAEEVVIDAVWHVLRRLSVLTFDAGADSDPMFSYLAKATKRGVYARYRSQQTEQRVLARAMNADPGLPPMSFDDARTQALFVESPKSDARPASPALLAEVEGFIAALSARDRLIVELRSQTNLAWDAIAAEAGMTSVAVRKRWQRLRERLLRLVPHSDEVTRGE